MLTFQLAEPARPGPERQDPPGVLGAFLHTLRPLSLALPTDSLLNLMAVSCQTVVFLIRTFRHRGSLNLFLLLN